MTPLLAKLRPNAEQVVALCEWPVHVEVEAEARRLK